ncbi:hypothetical protein ACHAW5_001385 [Stephanodiscus triporus]|uniref:Exonuclease domain-containing protein n=1 Tax=Stephanodiscus triporus TaxID=2934178 RepID=A0ABD3NGE2_9STRA
MTSQRQMMSINTRREANDNDDGDCNDASVTTSQASVNTGTVSHAVAASTQPPDVKPKRLHRKRKASKGRLKKLWRRAAGPPPGITSRTEWLELMELHSKQRGEAGPLPGPTVCLATHTLRDFSQLENWQTTEGSDHRDVLINLLFGGGGNNDGDHKSTTQQKQKKRKLILTSAEEYDDCDRGANSSSPFNIPPMPSWSNMSNIVSVGGVAVIEIEIIGGEKGMSCSLMPSRRIVDSMNAKCANVWTSLLRSSKMPIDGNQDNGNKVTRTIGAACKVKLFQENNKHPRCLSDVLMFLPPPPSQFDETSQKDSLDIFCAMNDLLLKSKQMRSEGFPVESRSPLSRTSGPASVNSLDAKLARERICKLSRTSLSSEDVQFDALELVSALSTNVVLNDIEEDSIEKGDEFSKMEHYVKSFSHHLGVSDSSSDVGDFNAHLNPVRQRKIFALDCEMVRTSSAAPELARVSVVMFTGGDEGKEKNVAILTCADEEKSIVVLDELVKPRRKVLDYITEYSGITPQMLQGVETRIEDIQVRLLSMLDEQDILVGHSLENDLHALRLVHDKVIDTSVIFRGMNGRKFSLKHLSNILLHKKIQAGSNGHCSSEDARAALVLALRRARHGDSFRLKESSKRQNIIGVFQKWNRAAKDAIAFAERNDGACVCIGDNDWIKDYVQSAEGAHHVLCCDTILNTMSMAVPAWLSSSSATKRAGLLWAKLRCEESANGKGQWKSEEKKLDELVKALVDRVPTHTPILMIFQKNYKKALALTRQRKASQNPKATLRWTSLQEKEWNDCLDECRNCEAIWI